MAPPKMSMPSLVPPMTPDAQEQIQNTLPFQMPPNNPLATNNTLLYLANFPNSNGQPQSIGDNMGNVARAMLGAAQMKNQYEWQRAMFPIQMMQQLAAYKKSMAPEAITTPAGIVNRDPLTGQLSRGMSLYDVAGMSNPQTAGLPGNSGQSSDDAAAQWTRSIYNGADPEITNYLKNAYTTSQQYYDPQKRADHLNTAIQTAYQREQAKGQFQQNQTRLQQNEDNFVQLRQQGLALQSQMAQIAAQRENRQQTEATGDLRPEAQKTMSDTANMWQTLDDIEKRIKPYADEQAKTGKANWPGGFTKARLEYAAGMDPVGTPLQGMGMAEAAMAQVAGGAQWLRTGGSRNVIVFNKAQEHLFNPWKDSPQNALSKIQNFKTQLQRQYNDAQIYGKAHAGFNPMTPPWANASAPNAASGNVINVNPDGTY